MIFSINNSWYNISSVQPSLVNNSLLRKTSTAAFVYSTTMTFSTHPASLLSCSSILISCVSQVQLYFCYYCRYMHLQFVIEFTVVSPGCWALWPTILFSDSSSDSLCLSPPSRNAPKLICWEPNPSLRQSFLWITCKPGKRFVVKSLYLPFFLVFLIERGKHDVVTT